MERCGKINCVNAEADSWTGMGVVVGFADVMGMLALSHRKKAALISLIVYLHILQCIRGIDKTRNHLVHNRHWCGALMIRDGTSRMPARMQKPGVPCARHNGWPRSMPWAPRAKT